MNAKKASETTRPPPEAAAAAGNMLPPHMTFGRSAGPAYFDGSSWVTAHSYNPAGMPMAGANASAQTEQVKKQTAVDAEGKVTDNAAATVMQCLEQRTSTVEDLLDDVDEKQGLWNATYPEIHAMKTKPLHALVDIVVGSYDPSKHIKLKKGTLNALKSAKTKTDILERLQNLMASVSYTQLKELAAKLTYEKLQTTQLKHSDVNQKQQLTYKDDLLEGKVKLVEELTENKKRAYEQAANEREDKLLLLENGSAKKRRN
jgi:hypothetical protein